MEVLNNFICLKMKRLMLSTFNEWFPGWMISMDNFLERTTGGSSKWNRFIFSIDLLRPWYRWKECEIQSEQFNKLLFLLSVITTAADRCFWWKQSAYCDQYCSKLQRWRHWFLFMANNIAWRSRFAIKIWIWIGIKLLIFYLKNSVCNSL